MRLAAEEGARAMDEATKEAVAVRKNMARLRELRLAKEAEEWVALEGQRKPKKRST